MQIQEALVCHRESHNEKKNKLDKLCIFLKDMMPGTPQAPITPCTLPEILEPQRKREKLMTLLFLHLRQSGINFNSMLQTFFRFSVLSTVYVKGEY
jgi:hypothetical protein